MSVFVSASFTVGSDTALTSYTGEVGGGYTAHTHINYNANPMTVDADTDRVFATVTAAHFADAVPPSADYYSKCDFFLHTAISQNIAVCARMDTVADTMYFGRLNNGTTWQLFKRVTGTSTQLGGDSTNQIPTAGNFKTGKIVVQGDQISFYVNDVLEIGPITDTSITAAGRIGIRNSGAASATTGMHFDNLEAGTLDAPPVGHGSFVINHLRPAIFKPGRPR